MGHQHFLGPATRTDFYPAKVLKGGEQTGFRNTYLTLCDLRAKLADEGILSARSGVAHSLAFIYHKNGISDFTVLSD